MVPVHEVGPIHPLTTVPAGGPAARLAVHISRDVDAVVVRLRGGLSGPRVPLFETVVHRLEKRRGARLILDLRGVCVIDAAGAAMVSRAERRAVKAGRSMTVLAYGGAVADAVPRLAPARVATGRSAIAAQAPADMTVVPDRVLGVRGPVDSRSSSSQPR